MNPNLLLIPVALHAFVTMGLFLPMSRARVRSVIDGKVRASVYKYNKEEPEESLKFSNAIRNQNETGVLFYAACLTAFVSGGASWLTVGLAFAFFAAKTAHVLIHTTVNQLRYRRPMFSVAILLLVILWAVVLVHLLSAL
jgi:hypothetical protein